MNERTDGGVKDGAGSLTRDLFLSFPFLQRSKGIKRREGYN